MSDNNNSILYTVNTLMDATLLPSFSSSSELVERLKAWVISNNFVLVIEVSDPRKIYLRCKCGGKYQSNLNEADKRKKTSRQECPFVIRIVKDPKGSCAVKSQNKSKKEHMHNHDLSLRIGMPSTAIADAFAASATAITAPAIPATAVPSTITAMPSTMPITATAMPNPPTYTEEL